MRQRVYQTISHDFLINAIKKNTEISQNIVFFLPSHEKKRKRWSDYCLIHDLIRGYAQRCHKPGIGFSRSRRKAVTALSEHFFSSGRVSSTEDMHLEDLSELVAAFTLIKCSLNISLFGLIVPLGLSLQGAVIF